jgi:hypothetical protein
MATSKNHPNKVFVVHSITRAGIAQDLNDALEVAPSVGCPPFAPNDERLTDAVCEDIARALNDAYTGSDESYEAFQSVMELALEAIITDTPRYTK